MKAALVTGAHGFLGRHVAAAFAGAGYAVHGIGLGEWGSERPAEFGIACWVEAEITLPVLRTLECRPDVVLHCAGSGSVGFSLANPDADRRMTVGTTAAVIAYLKERAPHARLIYPSSAAVYGGGHAGPIPVAAPLAPASPYGVHKLEAEALCRQAASDFGLDCKLVRFFSLYGNGLRKQLLWEASRRLAVAGPGDELEFFGTGGETRDWLHVRDAAALMLRLADAPAGEEVVNGGSGRAVTVAGVLAELATAFGCRCGVRFNGIVRAGDPPHLQADIGATLALGWQPKVSLAVGLRDYAAWFRSIPA